MVLQWVANSCPPGLVGSIPTGGVLFKMVIKIDYEKCCWKDGKCTSCGCGGECKGCVEACPTGALERGDIIIFHKDKCISCGVCVEVCEHDAITLE